MIRKKGEITNRPFSQNIKLGELRLKRENDDLPRKIMPESVFP
jgi:hypothetical protein